MRNSTARILHSLLRDDLRTRRKDQILAGMYTVAHPFGLSHKYFSVNENQGPSTTDDPRSNGQKKLERCHDFRDSARSNGPAALTKGESITRVDGHWTLQRDVELHTFAGQTHFGVADQ